MDPQNDNSSHKRHKAAWWFFATAAVFYLIAEHRAHLFGVLPWLLVLACPLMHFFMHGRHGQHGGHASHNREERP